MSKVCSVVVGVSVLFLAASCFQLPAAAAPIDNDIENSRVETGPVRYEWAIGPERSRWGLEEYAIDRFLAQRRAWMLVLAHRSVPQEIL